MEEGTDKLDIINRNLKEILMWLRFANIAKLKEFLEKELDMDAKKIVYENSDGLRPSSELAKISSTPDRTVISWWQRWYRQGIVVESEKYKRRMSNIVSLDDIGIKVPKGSSALKQDNPKSGDKKVSTAFGIDSDDSKDDPSNQ